jgi:hypothetical protein
MARTDIELDIYPLSIALQSKKITTSRTSFHIRVAKTVSTIIRGAGKWTREIENFHPI